MIDYGNCETAIKDKITPLLIGVDCRVLPETESDFRRITDSSVMICYNNSKFMEPKRMGGIQQDEELYFDIVIRSKKLRGDLGIYFISKILRAALLGFRIANCTEFTFIENGRAMSEDDFVDGVWTHTLTIKCKSFAIQVESIEEFVNLSRATFKSNPDFDVPQPV